jgi:hypothetical protein
MERYCLEQSESSVSPLVENAVRHGVSKTSAPVRIELKSSLSDSLLEIQVCDDGPGVSAGSSGNGVGLSNTRARLQQLYGDRQSLRLDSVVGGRTGGDDFASLSCGRIQLLLSAPEPTPVLSDPVVLE